MKLIKPASLPRQFVAIDATWYMPNNPKSARDEYIRERLPSARFFDLDAVKADSPYPHMMPSAATFEQALSGMGVRNSDTIVVYDKDFFSSHRLYWMLEIFGHKDLYLLDNFSQYAADGRDLETGPPSELVATQYKVPSSTGKWIEFEEMEQIARDPNYVILDARPAPRFFGEAPEPRPGLSNGHIPGAYSLPFGEVLENGHYKSPEAIAKLLEDRNVDLSKQVVVMCGSGVTACVIKYAIDPLLKSPALVYDGSWTEWAQRSTYIEGASS